MVLKRITHQKSIQIQIKRRKWNWIGHTLCKETGTIEKTALDWNWIGHTLCKETGATEKTALDWNPQGYRRRGRLKIMWQRTIENEI